MERTLGFYEFAASPNFCWTTCFIYKSLMEAGESLPETLTQLFVCITVHLIWALSLDKDHARDLVCALGRMASHCCLGSHPHCSTEEMNSFDLQRFQTTPTSLKDFVRTVGDPESKNCTFSFHTQMMQEFIMAVSFYLDGSEEVNIEDMLASHKGRVDFLDLYLAGLSEPSQRKPLESHVGEFNTDHIVDFSSWFKSATQKALQSWHVERHLHFLRLLHQSQNGKLVKENMRHARLISYGRLSVHDCVVFNYAVTCTEEWDRLNLYRSTDLTEEKAILLVPAMSLSRVIMLSQSSLTPGALNHLALALRQGRTIELDMSYNSMGNIEFKLLCTGLEECHIEVLILPLCDLTDACCEDLAAVLSSGRSHLRVLNLAGNALGDPGLSK
ncbi:hypothetical protein DPEC_G00003750 [Dallia pectoralis]|uniref:Uncharacterized protein n=1 Tax=Dallia pectoralis TaxID=75939 RepID=A0ACC2HJN1_DALPE|nr:hypothetical protein DPEC_G00003750 [Dallia pectoralis]